MKLTNFIEFVAIIAIDECKVVITMPREFYEKFVFHNITSMKICTLCKNGSHNGCMKRLMTRTACDGLLALSTKRRS